MKLFFSLDDPDLVELINSGGIGVIPSDTVYGLVASASNRQAVERMYALKHREKKPGTTIAASTDQLIHLGIPPADLTKAAKLWPNPLSIILTPNESFSYIHQGKGASPFRVVKDATISSLLSKTGPLVTTSANEPGQPTAVDITEAQKFFGENVDFYVDGGLIGERPPSTIIRFTEDGGIELIRQGAVVITDSGEIE